MTTTGRCATGRALSLREFAEESEHVDGWFARLVAALPTGARGRIQSRTGISKNTMDDACQLRHVRPPLVLAIEGLREVRPELRRDLADDLLAPLGLAVIPRPDETRDVAGLLAMNSAYLSAVASSQDSLAESLADGVMKPSEAVQLAAELTQTKAAIEFFLAGLGVGK